MGIEVRQYLGKREVLHTSHHQNLVDTSVSRSPYRQRAGDLTVWSIFRRRKARGGDGDGNPLVYALKGMKNYTISNKDLWAMRAGFNANLEKFMDSKIFDQIAPMPSNAPIARLVAKKALMHQRGCLLRGGLFSKLTTEEVAPQLEEALEHRDFPPRLRGETQRLINTLRNRPPNDFTMKLVHQRPRPFICPVV